MELHPTLPHITLHSITLPHITLHCIPHCLTSHYIASQCCSPAPPPAPGLRWSAPAVSARWPLSTLWCIGTFAIVEVFNSALGCKALHHRCCVSFALHRVKHWSVAERWWVGCKYWKAGCTHPWSGCSLGSLQTSLIRNVFLAS